MTFAPGGPQGDAIIQVMPEPLANKIAAGEVVQRPASALKELVENSLDAGARHVTVLLKAAGSELVQIIDDGGGMSAADAEACFRRHATSKIRQIEDLETLATLGFRGEALASIAAVAQVEVRTRRANDDVGTRVRVEGGHHMGTEPVATPTGTSVAVRNLFYNVPARRSFLKSPATEYKHLLETFQFLALSHPAVGFTLFHNDEEVFTLQGRPDADSFEALRARIGEVFGAEHGQKLVKVEEATSYLSMAGFVAEPGFSRRARGEQFLYVNDRYVRNRSIDHAIFSGYEGLVPKGTYPFFVLFLSLDPGHVDVNVHPTKAEVKFDDERGVHGFVRAVVRKALGMATATPRAQQATPAQSVMTRTVPPRAAALPGEAFPGATLYAPPTRTGTGTGAASASALPADDDAPFDVSDLPDALPAQVARATATFAPATPAEAAPLGQQTLAAGTALHPDEADGRPDVLVQLHDGYILTSIRSGLMILDQQAAHERILYERALSTLNNGVAMSQQLLFPRTIEFSAPDLALVRELLPELQALGFDLEPFGGRSIVVRGVPADIPSGDERSILDDLLEQYRAHADALRVSRRELLARSMARRSAMPARRRLTEKEMRSLIDQLFDCQAPMVSPDGRPTLIKISVEELRRRFGRS